MSESAPDYLEDLCQGVSDFLEFVGSIMTPIVEFTYVGPEREQSFEMMRRSALRRQFEALEATVRMSKDGYGHFAVTFLRPAYEELLWFEYLGANLPEANTLLNLLANNEIGENVIAQYDFAGGIEMGGMGFRKSFMRNVRTKHPKFQDQIREVGTRLGWDTSRGVMPTMLFLAQKTNRVKEFQYLYRGTSRFVHFSTMELMRRVWGHKGKVQIGSSTFTRYWDSFALYWGFRLLLDSVVNNAQLFGSHDYADEKLTRMLEVVGRFGKVPIITAGELFWPD
jgi:Family of unknown function (DUF5677)